MVEREPPKEGRIVVAKEGGTPNARGPCHPGQYTSHEVGSERRPWPSTWPAVDLTVVLAAQQRQNPERKRQDYMGGDEQHQVALQAQPFKDLNKQKPALTAWLWGRCSRGRWERSKREEGGSAKSRGEGCGWMQSGGEWQVSLETHRHPFQMGWRKG